MNMSLSTYLQASRMTVVGERSPVDRRRREIERVNKQLSRGNYETALSLVKQLKGKHGCLPTFGSAKLLPKKLQVCDKPDSLLIDSVTRTIESVSAESRISKDDETKTCSLEQDWFTLVQHESGHFLVGYLLGYLPRHYEIPNLEDIKQNVSSLSGRVGYVGLEFLKEFSVANKLMKGDDVHGLMNRLPNQPQGYISSTRLNNVSCVILGGMVTEQILFGYSKGFYADAVKLNNLLRWRGFTEIEKEAHIRWAALNTVSLLRSYNEARVSLAEAMAKSKSIGECIEAIESVRTRHLL